MTLRINGIEGCRRRGLRRIQACAAALLLSLSVAPAALAASKEERGPAFEDGRWIPSIAIFGGVSVQDMTSAVESHCANGRPEENVQLSSNTYQVRPACRDPSGIFAGTLFGEGTLRPARRGQERATTPLVGGFLALTTPRIHLVPGGPRVFVSGELLAFFPGHRDIAREGVPKGIAFPPPQSAVQGANAVYFSADALFGVGSVTRSQVQTLGWGAHAGVAFPFDLLGRRLWLKPSVGWMRYGVDVDGAVFAGLKDDGFGLYQNQADVRKGPGIRAINLQSSTSRTFDGVGPGLELEMEAGRFGPLGVSVFLFTNAYRIIGDRSVHLRASVTCDPPASPCASGLVNTLDAPVTGTTVVSAVGPVPGAGVLIPNTSPFGPFGKDTYTADWSFAVNPWAYRGGIGIRFHWIGN